MRLAGKVPLVTGSTQGIGKAIAERYAAEGASVAVVASKDLQRAESVASEIRAKGGKAAGFVADCADEEETAATIRTTLRETSRLIDPHTAVGLAVAEKETRDPAVPMIVLGTAHPAKFPDAVEAACGVRPG